MLKCASNWDGGCEFIVAASQTLLLSSLVYAVFVRIKTRAGRVGVYLKEIVTCVINFLIYVINFLTYVIKFLTLC